MSIVHKIFLKAFIIAYGVTSILVIVFAVRLASIRSTIVRTPIQESTDTRTVPEVEPLNISDWQTYKNEEYGFEFQYPTPITIDSFYNNGGSFYSLAFAPNTSLEWVRVYNDPLAETPAVTIDDIIFPFLGVVTTDTTLNGVPAKLQVFPLEGRERTVLNAVRNGYGYQIAFEDNDVSQKILTTFQFIKSVDTPNWKTHRNDDMGYEVQIPNNWKAEGGVLYSPQSYDARGSGIYSLEINVHSDLDNIDDFLKNKGECIQEEIYLDLKNRAEVQYSDLCYYQIPLVYLVVSDGVVVEGLSNVLSDANEGGTISRILASFRLIELDVASQQNESYIACGCGCCGGVDPQDSCLYHSQGDSLEKIIKEDKEAFSSGGCQYAGCSLGIRYSYCD